MRAVVQRVSHARVRVGSEVVGEIGPGLLALVGAAQGDGEADVAWLVDKLAHLRVFEDDGGKMNRSLADCGHAALVVSQFTLLGDTGRGRRPGFSGAAPPAVAAPLIEGVVAGLRERGVPVQTGRFGAHMAVELENDGPVTLILETPERVQP